jgi:hypothetical protein
LACLPPTPAKSCSLVVFSRLFGRITRIKTGLAAKHGLEDPLGTFWRIFDGFWCLPKAKTL